ncbi:cyclin-dependent kinase inhibitor 3-like [Bidens hawaiensis]|uniref:cyclin-dependent kinase inhibitor 3-like n=1 Tax=Bidens hawaiensis TaxID=980011 RepID=UPI00404AB56F
MEVAPAMDNSGSTKRRKVVSNGELMLKPVRIAGCVSDSALSCCSIDGDLEVSGETEGNLVRRESPLKHLRTHTLSPDSMAGSFTTPTAEKPESGERKPVPAAEIEEFFAAAEKEIQSRFKNKYNYDTVKDVPLKGRYEWIQLKQ